MEYSDMFIHANYLKCLQDMSDLRVSREKLTVGTT